MLVAAGATAVVLPGPEPAPSPPQALITAAPVEAATIPPAPSPASATAEPPTAVSPSAIPPQVPAVPVVSAADLPSASIEASAVPVRIEYPGVGADLPITPTGVADDGQMEIPADAADAGWYRFGPAPGDGAGHAVIAAHSGSEETPEGPLYAIRDGAPGDEVTVTDQAGTRHVFVVTSVERLGKDGLDFTPYFARTGPERLVLVTCGGQWLPERGSYADNVIVVAEPRS